MAKYSKDIMDKINKIKALVDRGVGGEKESAEILLQRLLAKYDISINEIESDAVSEHEFQFWGHLGEKLFGQVVFMVTGHCEILKYIHKRNCKTRFVRCTEMEAIEIKEAFEFYRYHLDEGFKNYYKAFVNVEFIFPEDVEITPITDVDLDMLRLANGMDKHDRLLKLNEVNQ